MKDLALQGRHWRAAKRVRSTERSGTQKRRPVAERSGAEGTHQKKRKNWIFFRID